MVDIFHLSHFNAEADLGPNLNVREQDKRRFPELRQVPSIKVKGAEWTEDSQTPERAGTLRCGRFQEDGDMRSYDQVWPYRAFPLKMAAVGRIARGALPDIAGAVVSR